MKPQTITDLDGKVIEVTDLDGAIKEVGGFWLLHRAIAKKSKFDFVQVAATNKAAYWLDIHNKLIQLKNNQQ